MTNDGSSIEAQGALRGRQGLAPQRRKRFTPEEFLEEFFKACDAMEGPGRGPDWEEHLRIIDESRRRGLTDTYSSESLA